MGKLTKDDLVKYKEVYSEFDKCGRKIINRVDAIIGLLCTQFGVCVGNWGFVDEPEDCGLNYVTTDVFLPHGKKQVLSVSLYFPYSSDANSMSVGHINYAHSIPMYFLLLTDHEIESIVQKEIEDWEKRQEKAAAAALTKKEAAIKRALAKLTKEDIKVLGLTKER